MKDHLMVQQQVKEVLPKLFEKYPNATKFLIGNIKTQK